MDIKTFRRTRKNALRDKYEFLMYLMKSFEETPTTDPDALEKRNDFIAKNKREIRALAKKMGTDRLAKSLREAPRGVANEWGDHTTFGFLDADAVTATDEEIREYLDNTMRIELMCSYGNPDGAGNPFTSRLEFYRTPCGVAYIHCVSLNI